MSIFSTPKKEPPNSLGVRSKFFDTSNNWIPSSTNIITNIETPWERPLGINKFAKVIDNILTPDECLILINESEDKGFEDALVNVGFGKQVLMKDIRK